MQTLKEYIKKLQKIVKNNPEFANLPVIYADDEQGHQFSKVTSEPIPCEVDDINERYLDLIGTLGDDFTEESDINAILIN